MDVGSSGRLGNVAGVGKVRRGRRWGGVRVGRAGVGTLRLALRQGGSGRGGVGVLRVRAILPHLESWFGRSRGRDWD